MAAAELAAVLSVCTFMGLAAYDYSRSVYAAVAVANCARTGAMYSSDSTFAASSGYSSASQAALADAGNLSPQPTVTTSSGTDSKGTPYVAVTVAYTFQTTVNYPGIPNSVTLTRTVKMPVAPP